MAYVWSKFATHCKWAYPFCKQLRSIVDVLILTRIDLEIHHHKTAEIMLPEKKQLVWRSKEHKEDGIGGWDEIGFKFEIYKL